MWKFLTTLVFFVNYTCLAATTECADVGLIGVTVEGNRDDSHEFQNKMILEIDKPCAGKKYLHADLSHPAFNGFLSIALAAKSMNKRVTVSVNSSNVTYASIQIAYIYLKD